MLCDRPEPDPFFWAVIEKLAIEMEPELAQIDKTLDDDELLQLIKHDTSQRYPQTLETGRNSTPVEVNLRMLAVKRLYCFTYRQTEWHVGDSLLLRWFCRSYFKRTPDHTTLNRWTLLIKAEALHAFNERIDTLARNSRSPVGTSCVLMVQWLRPTSPILGTASCLLMACGSFAVRSNGPSEGLER